MVTHDIHYWEKFGFFGGNIFLDFVNTFDDLGKNRDLDAIPNWNTLVRWAEKSGLISKNEMVVLADFSNTKATQIKIHTLQNLRESAWHVLSKIASNKAPDPHNLKILSNIVKLAYTESSLIYSNQSFSWGTRAKVDETTIQTRLALSANGLLTSVDLKNLSECGSCTGLFLNKGRGLGRKWCRMNTCGNRAKIKKFRANK
jgi:predicted RNA-binding Zn ribbon-like protein